MTAVYLDRVSQGENLSLEEARGAVSWIFQEASDSQIGALLMGLKVKGETVEEIAGFAKGMRDAARTIKPRVRGRLVDTCGTGGDASGTINVSSAAALVAAGAGVAIAKHGNYSITSKSGSADVLKALGVKIDLEPSLVEKTIEKTGIGFMLAPVFHPSMKRVASIRRELGVRTIFNILGPLTNPAGAEAQVIGVYDPELGEKIAQVLVLLGVKHALVVHGAGGLDEISNTGETQVWEVKKGGIEHYRVTPEELGFKKADIQEIKGGMPEENARTVLDILQGKKDAKLDIVLMNAAAAIYVSGRAGSLAEGVEMAREAIDSGSALYKLEQLRAETNAG